MYICWEYDAILWGVMTERKWWYVMMLSSSHNVMLLLSVYVKNYMYMYYIYATQRIRKTCYFCITIWDYVYSVYFHSHCLFCDPFYAQVIFLIYDAIK